MRKEDEIQTNLNLLLGGYSGETGNLESANENTLNNYGVYGAIQRLRNEINNQERNLVILVVMKILKY